MISHFISVGLIVFIIIFAHVTSSKNECNHRELMRNVTITNLSEKIDFGLTNGSGLTNYTMTVTYSWDIDLSEESDFDGFIYCFENSDDQLENIFNPSGGVYHDSFPGFFSPFSSESSEFSESFESFESSESSEFSGFDPYDSCLEYQGQTFWVTDVNGTYRNCSYPCKNELNQDCIGEFPSVCSHLSKNCKALPKHQRNISFPVVFAMKYDFSLLPYSGQEANYAKTQTFVSYSLFCGHHLIENLTMPQDSAYEFCRSRQDIGTFTATSPPAALNVEWIHRNYEENTVTVTVRWRNPHDIRSGSNLTDFFVHASEKHKEKGRIKAKTPDEVAIDPFYSLNLTFSGITNTRVVRLDVTPSVVSDQTCPDTICSLAGELARLVVLIEGYHPCNTTRNNTRYCDAEATCVPLNGKGRILANCSCPEGYNGNGENPILLSKGEGCTNFNACTDGVKRFCSHHALCVDAPPPNMTVLSCRCQYGYLGDGYVSGSGCTHIALVITFPLLFLIFLVGAAVIAIRVRCRLKNKRLLEATLSRFVPKKSGTYLAPLSSLFSMTSDIPSSPQPVFGQKHELDRSAIMTHEIIGRGNFGVVHRATLETDEGPEPVAVKSLTGVYTANHRDDFLAEISLLIHLGEHENILSVKGVCTTSSFTDDDNESLSPLLVTEYMIYGDLLHFLWTSRDPEMRENEPIYNFTEISLCKIGRQVANGMHFLSQSRIIHGDVAARNILVGEDLKIKISDFGLANDVYRYGLIKGATERRVPFKWISPERMMGGKTPVTWKSDVWSFGILLYEMVTLGAVPYPSMDPVTIFYKLQGGYRMPQPPSCSDYLYKVMKSCWEWNYYSRPAFNQLSELLQDAYSPPSGSFYPAIEVTGKVDETTYERDIGRRDSCEISPADEDPFKASHQFSNGALLENGHENVNHIEQHSTDILVTTDDSPETQWQPWPNDIPISLNTSNESTGSDEHLV